MQGRPNQSYCRLCYPKEWKISFRNDTCATILTDCLVVPQIDCPVGENTLERVSNGCGFLAYANNCKRHENCTFAFLAYFAVDLFYRKVRKRAQRGKNQFLPVIY